MQPLITIGITCYNAQDTIQRAIEAALSQDWPNLEILIVDDKSTDNSVGVVRGFLWGHKNTRLIVHEENTGPAGARNTILKNARGEFIVFHDDDDEASNDRVTVQYKYITNYERKHDAKFVCCYASGVRTYDNGYSVDLSAIGSEGEACPQGPELLDYLLFYERRKDWFYGTGTPSCSLMCRKSTLESVEGFDANLRRVEDVDLAIRLALRGCHFIGTKENLFVQHATNAVDKSPEKNLKAEQAVVKKYKDYLIAKKRYYHALYWPQLRYYHFKKKYAAFVVQLIGLFFVNPVKVCQHLIATGPRRLQHEKNMRKAKG